MLFDLNTVFVCLEQQQKKYERKINLINQFPDIISIGKEED